MALFICFVKITRNTIKPNNYFIVYVTISLMRRVVFERSILEFPSTMSVIDKFFIAGLAPKLLQNITIVFWQPFSIQSDTMRKSGLMMKLLTPFIWSSSVLSLSLSSLLHSQRLVPCVQRQSQTKTEITINKLCYNDFNDDEWWYWFVSGRTIVDLQAAYSLVLLFRTTLHVQQNFLHAPLTACKTIIKLINVQTVIKAINHSIDREIYLFSTRASQRERCALSLYAL